MFVQKLIDVYVKEIAKKILPQLPKDWVKMQKFNLKQLEKILYSGGRNQSFAIVNAHIYGVPVDEAVEKLVPVIKDELMNYHWVRGSK